MLQLAYVFENNRINGRTLSIISKEDLNDLNIKCIGDRVYLFELLKIMKKASTTLRVVRVVRCAAC